MIAGLATPRRSSVYAVFLLAVLALLVYAVNLDDYFLGDDFDLIHSFHDKPASYFFELLYNTQAGDAWDHQGLDITKGQGFIRPLSIWLLRLDFGLWRTNALGFHLTSSVVFALLVVTVFLVLQMLLRASGPAFIGALAAAVHPLFSQVVPWISGREEFLAAWLCLAAFGFFLRHRMHGSSAAGYHACYALALLTKEWAISAIGLTVLYDLVCARPGPRLQDRLRLMVRTHAPAVLIVLGYLGLRWLAFGNLKGGYGTQTHYFSPASFASYHAAFFRELFGKTMVSFVVPMLSVLAGLVLGAIVFMLVRRRDRLDPGYFRQLVFFGPVWYLVSTLVLHGIEFWPRHGTLPLVGLILFASLLVHGLLLVLRSRWRTTVTGAVLASTVVCFLPRTLEHALMFDTASKAVREIRSRIEDDTAGLEPGSTVYIARVPQDELPPYYFGWSLLAALQRPFTESDLAARSLVVNPQNLWMNGTRVDMPAEFDRVLDYPWPRQRVGGFDPDELAAFSDP